MQHPATILRKRCESENLMETSLSIPLLGLTSGFYTRTCGSLRNCKVRFDARGEAPKAVVEEVGADAPCAFGVAVVGLAADHDPDARRRRPNQLDRLLHRGQVRGHRR